MVGAFATPKKFSAIDCVSNIGSCNTNPSSPTVLSPGGNSPFASATGKPGTVINNDARLPKYIKSSAAMVWPLISKALSCIGSFDNSVGVL